jgi:hypothetical protein
MSDFISSNDLAYARNPKESVAIMTSSVPKITVDGVSAMGVHNQIVRVNVFTINADGKSEVTAELLLTLVGLKSLIESLNKAQNSPKRN